MPKHTLLFVGIVVLGLPVFANGRTWTDSTGNYKTDAEMIGFNDSMVVLKRVDHRLVAVPIEKLSKEDRDYLASKETAEQARQSSDALQTWTMASGLKVPGRILEYGKRDVTIQRKLGKLYVNDRKYENLPEVNQKMLLKLVSHFENIEIKDKRDLDAWAAKLRGEPRTYHCEGVMMELEDGDVYGVPFFFFSKEDRKILQPGWERWLAADKDRTKQEHESFMLQSQAQAYQKDQKTNQQIALMQIQMQGYQAGMFDLWEVQLFPGPGVAGQPLVVVAPGRDSRNAAAEAIRRNPGYRAGAVSKVARK